MAKVVITFDTQDKSLTATMDGKTVENLESASFYRGYNYDTSKSTDEFRCNLTTVEKKEDDGVSMYTQISAKQSAEGREAIAQGAGTYALNDDFVAHKRPSEKIVNDISEFFRSRRQR